MLIIRNNDYEMCMLQITNVSTMQDSGVTLANLRKRPKCLQRNLCAEMSKKKYMVGQ
jgi:hypothetical protein